MQLKKRGNSVVVLESDEFFDAKDTELAKVYSYKDVKLFGRTFTSFRDFVPSYVLKVLEIVRTNRLDLMESAHPSGACAAKVASILTRKKIPLVYAPYNVESELIKQTFSKDLRYTRFERRVLPSYYHALEKLVCKYFADAVIAVSEHDRDMFIDMFGLDRDKVYVVPSGCTPGSLPSEVERHAIREALGIHHNALCVLFHGYYVYGPNREAFDAIQSYIAPRVAARNERALFVLAGSGAPSFERGNVKSLGFVEDLWQLLGIADVALVPLTRGSGTKLKVFDYMNAAVPIVATRKAMEGIAAVDGRDALIAETVNDEFIDKLLYLLDNARERKHIGASGRQLLEARYTWDAIGTTLMNTYKNIVEGRDAS